MATRNCGTKMWVPQMVIHMYVLLLDCLDLSIFFVDLLTRAYMHS
jgi:hypothetical protein